MFLAINLNNLFKMFLKCSSCYNQKVVFFFNLIGDFPGGAVVKNSPANAGNTVSSPGLGRSHMPRSN